MRIIGAGLSGLLAGCMFPGSTIYEKQATLPNNHGAVLRFRSDEISYALGIPFKKVRVMKSIWLSGEEVEPTPRVCNMYAHKVTGTYTSRSIGNVDPVDRYIAPDNFIEQLASRCQIAYQHDFCHFDGEAVISTMPMPVLMKLLGIMPNYPEFEFKRAPIWSTIYEFNDVDLYQTIYFPGFGTSVYRASFTGNRLIIESKSDPINDVRAALDDALTAFGINNQPYSEEVKRQEYGKIIDIDNDLRRKIMGDLTHELNIYSLGRYATWRNILLDDVFHDLHTIRNLHNMDSYSRKMDLAK